MRLPKWTEDELILTLELYFKIKSGEKKHSHSTLKEMSENLRGLNTYPEFNDNTTFRNVNGISRKLGNFSAIDPDYEGKGLYACSLLDREIFMKFYKKPTELAKAVAAIGKKHSQKTKKKQFLWTEDELVLTLALYNTLTYGQMHGANPKVIALSKILRELPIYPKDSQPENFRSIASVSLRLSNFRSCDPECNAKGLLSSRTGLFKEVFIRYYRKDKLLADTVLGIEQKYQISIRHIIAPEKSSKENNAEDIPAATPYQTHKNKETDSSFYRKVKGYHYGKSKVCSICKADSIKTYGKLGEDILEYHCIKKFLEADLSNEVCIGDYIQICPVCHKLLDKYYGLVDYDDLKNVIRNEK
jgi:hypothetical protein